jgi:hypothetical protein
MELDVYVKISRIHINLRSLIKISWIRNFSNSWFCSFRYSEGGSSTFLHNVFDYVKPTRRRNLTDQKRNFHLREELMSENATS